MAEEVVFDAAMKERLLAFQKANGLKEDGLVAAKTWAKLAESTPAPAATPEPVLISAAEFPELFAIAEACRTEEGFWALLSERSGVDFAEILANIDAVLEDA